MNITPQPITEDTDSMSDRSPIGTRYADSDGTYTLVAYSIDPHAPQYARPVLVADDDLANLLYPEDVCGIDSEILAVAPADQEAATKARAAAVGHYQARPYRDTGEFGRVMAFADLATDEELAAFLAFAKAELELRETQWKLERAARERSEKIARIYDVKGSQQAAAQALGLNQSTVSRALRERPERP